MSLGVIKRYLCVCARAPAETSTPPTAGLHPISCSQHAPLTPPASSGTSTGVGDNEISQS